MGKRAALHAADLIREAIDDHGHARLIFSAASSQLPMLDTLVTAPGIAWAQVVAFHVDEYLSLPPTHPQSFAGWFKRNFVDRARPGTAHYLCGNAADIIVECRRYADLLAAAPIDVSFLGFGENGHIGFNDPHEANFTDPLPVRTVTLDEKCRLQQFREAEWPDLSAVPGVGVTLTCPTLVHADHIICCVPGARKAQAVRDALEGPVSPACPGSLLRTHPRAHVYLDVESASLLSQRTTGIQSDRPLGEHG
jgi:glucosamine-6-phosphate deaminase